MESRIPGEITFHEEEFMTWIMISLLPGELQLGDAYSVRKQNDEDKDNLQKIDHNLLDIFFFIYKKKKKKGKVSSARQTVYLRNSDTKE